MLRHSWPILSVSLVLIALGCAQQSPTPPISDGVPLGLQMLRTEAQMRKYPFRILQQFEQPVDLAFLRVEGPPAKLDSSHAHTGASSVALDPGTKSLTVQLPSLLSGVTWPDQWTLAGAYFYADQSQRLSAAYEVDGSAILFYTVELPAKQWTPVLLDIASIQGAIAAKVGTLKFSFGNGLSTNLLCDDVILLNNTDTHAETNDWKVTERGFEYTIQRQGAFKVNLKTPEASSAGWTLQEANVIRACFTSRGNEKYRVIYASGSAYTDGKYQSLLPAREDSEEMSRQHAEPGQITVAADMGRVDRNSAGDANNDGYAEQSGTYQIIATGPRVEFTISPRSGSQLIRPVIEIAGLPAGNILATLEGRLIDRIVRLENGHVIIEIPGSLTRPTSANVKISQP